MKSCCGAIGISLIWLLSVSGYASAQDQGARCGSIITKNNQELCSGMRSFLAKLKSGEAPNADDLKDVNKQCNEHMKYEKELADATVAFALIRINHQEKPSATLAPALKIIRDFHAKAD